MASTEPKILKCSYDGCLFKRIESHILTCIIHKKDADIKKKKKLINHILHTHNPNGTAHICYDCKRWIYKCLLCGSTGNKYMFHNEHFVFCCGDGATCRQDVGLDCLMGSCDKKYELATGRCKCDDSDYDSD